MGLAMCWITEALCLWQEEIDSAPRGAAGTGLSKNPTCAQSQKKSLCMGPKKDADANVCCPTTCAMKKPKWLTKAYLGPGRWLGRQGGLLLRLTVCV